MPTPYDDVEQWLCFEDEQRCDCYGRPGDTRIESSREATPGCAAALDCCFVKDLANGHYDCTCIETPPDETGGAGAGGEGGGAHVELSRESRCVIAAAESGSMSVTPVVVPHCPPVTLDSAGVCALTFESCDAAYLKENGLVACCTDLVCQPDSTGQKICVVPN
jgi:hypothetical protein